MTKSFTKTDSLNKKGTPAVENAFEKKIQRLKHHVMGQKVKGVVGRTVIARTRANEMRQETIGVELSQSGKKNMFLDKRFGESDDQMTAEDKMLMRFQKEKQRQFQKRSKFNLEDDDGDDGGMQLTHLGKPLNEIDDFDEDIPNDSDDDDQLDKDIVSKYHFGGLQLKKKSSGEEGEEEYSKPKTKKEVMAEIVAKSKMYKAERQREKEQQIDQTEQLDEDFKEIQHLLGVKPKGNRQEEKMQEPQSDFDRITRELATEIRAQASDRLKTPEELAKEEMERLEQAEKDRIRRMKGEDDDDDSDGEKPPRDRKRKRGIQSADDLEENFVLEDEDNDDVEDNGSDDDVEDNGSDDEDDDNKKEKEKAAKKKRLATTAAAADEPIDDSIPFLFNMPTSEEELDDILSPYTVVQRKTVIKRIITRYHPSLQPQNKILMESFFEILMQRFEHLCVQEPIPIEEIDNLCSNMYEVASLVVNTATTIARQKIEEIFQGLHLNDEVAEMCGFESIMICKLLGMLFPVSDLRHPITTPAVILMTSALSLCAPHTWTQAKLALFLATTLFDYVAPARRYCPELIKFLTDMISSVAAVDLDEAHPSAKSPLFLMQWLAPKKDKIFKGVKSRALMAMDDIVSPKTNDYERLKVLNGLIALCKEVVAVYGSLPAAAEFLLPLSQSLALIPKNIYSAHTQKSLQELEECVNDARAVSYAGRYPLTLHRKHAVPLKMANPKFEEDYVPSRDYDPDRQRAELKKLQREHSKEQSAAVRELRKDNAFVAAAMFKKDMQARDKYSSGQKKARAFLHQQYETLNQHAKMKKGEKTSGTIKREKSKARKIRSQKGKGRK